MGYTMTEPILGDCIYDSPRLNAINMVNYMSHDCVAIKVIFQGENWPDRTNVSSSYHLFEKQDLLSSEAKALVGDCSWKEHKLEFGYDENAHHTVWSNTDCNEQED